MELKLLPQHPAFQEIDAALRLAFPADFAGLLSSVEELVLVFDRDLSQIEQDLAAQITQDTALDYISAQSVEFNMEIPDGNS